MRQEKKHETPSWTMPIAGTVLLVLHFFVLAPLHVLRSNAWEFTAPSSEIMGYLVIPALLFTVACFMLLSALRRSGHIRGFSVFYGIVLFLYLQFFFFVWNYGVFDGSPLDWKSNHVRGVIELVVFTGIAGASFFFAKHFLPYALLVIGVLFAGQGAITFFHGSTPEPPSKAVAAESITEEKKAEIYTFSGKKNIILVMLDEFQNDVFEHMLENSPEMKAWFPGFTFFRNATSAFPHTMLSIHSMLTGKPYHPPEAVPSYRERTREEAFTFSLKKQGVPVTYLDPHNVARYLPDPDNRALVNAISLFDVVLFRQAPHFLKPFIFRDYRFIFRTLFPHTSFEVQKDLQLLAGLSEKATVRDTPLTLKFYQLWGSHPPVIMNRDCEIQETGYGREDYADQAYCVLEKVGRFFTRLQELGVYEESLIFLFGDHGNRTDFGIAGVEPPPALAENIMSSAHPVLTMKPPGTSSGFAYSDAPASLLDISATIQEFTGLAPSSEGLSLVRAAAFPPDRPRTFFYFNNANEAREEQISHMRKYLIRGPVRNPSSWKLEEEFVEKSRFSPYLPGQVIRFGKEGNAKPFQGEGWSGAEPLFTWSFGGKSTLFFSLKNYTGGALRLTGKVRALLRGKVPYQRIFVRVNGVLLDEIRVDRENFHLLPPVLIPEDVLEKNPDGMVLEFDLPDNFQPRAAGINNDTRYLAVSFWELQLDPV